MDLKIEKAKIYKTITSKFRRIYFCNLRDGITLPQPNINPKTLKEKMDGIDDMKVCVTNDAINKVETVILIKYSIWKIVFPTPCSWV